MKMIKIIGHKTIEVILGVSRDNFLNILKS